MASALGSWRWALRVSPPIGVALIIIYVLFTRDPPRGASEGHGHGGESANENSGLMGFFKDVKDIVSVPSFNWVTAGFATVTYATGRIHFLFLKANVVFARCSGLLGTDLYQ